MHYSAFTMVSFYRVEKAHLLFSAQRLACSGDECIQLYDAASSQLSAVLGSDDILGEIHASLAGSRLVGIDTAGRVVVGWKDVAVDERTLLESSCPVRCVALSGDGSLVVTGHDDGIVRLWRQQAECELLRGHTHPVHSVCASYTGALIISASDCSVRVWSNCVLMHLCRVTGSRSSSALCAVLSEDSSWFISGTSDGRLDKWSTESGTVQWTQARDSPVYCLALSEHRNVFAAGGPDKKVHVFDTRQPALLASLLHTAPVYSLSFSVDTRWLACGTEDNSVYIWTTPMHVSEGKPGKSDSASYDCNASSGAASATASVVQTSEWRCKRLPADFIAVPHVTWLL